MRNKLVVELPLRAAIVSCFAISSSPALSESQCQKGEQIIALKIMLSSGYTFTVNVGSDYFDQRFIPVDGGIREGLLLRMQATDFSPWPRELRPHTSEGPLMSYLLTDYLPLSIVADRYARIEAGHRLVGEVKWTRAPGPFGLSSLSASPPEEPLVGLMGRNDVYVAVDSQGTITDVIRCQRPGRRPFQTCDHLIEAGEIDIKLNYAPRFLADWARLSSGATQFLDCMTGE